jgi:hypothetical protein
MLRPVAPARSLVRPARRTSGKDEADVHVEIIPPRGAPAPKVGRAKVTGRTIIINRKGP